MSERYTLNSLYNPDTDLLIVEARDNFTRKTQKAFRNLGGEDRSRCENEIFYRFGVSENQIWDWHLRGSGFKFTNVLEVLARGAA